MGIVETDTDFLIAGRPIPAASMRGVKGEISPIDNGVVVEMLDFSLRDLTAAEGRKFEGSLSCEDMNAPPFWGVWKGQRWTVDWPNEVFESVADPQLRPHVPGTLYWVDADDAEEVEQNDPRATFRVYRPRLDIVVMEPWKMSFSEWEATSSWTLKWREA